MYSKTKCYDKRVQMHTKREENKYYNIKYCSA
jgi:hypothetical protein